MFLHIFLRYNCLIFSIITLVFSYFYFFNIPLPNFQSDMCPICFGDNFCEKLTTIEISSSNITEKIYHFFNVKNVIYAETSTGKDIVLKKLAHDSDWEELDKEILNRMNQICVTNQVNDKSDMNCEKKVNDDYCDEKFDSSHEMYLNSNLNIIVTGKCNNGLIKPMKIDNLIDLIKRKLIIDDNKINMNRYFCNRLNIKRFLDRMLSHFEVTHLWTMLKINIEPIILQLLQSEDGWPVPKYYGACGRYIIEENSGETLTDYAQKRSQPSDDVQILIRNWFYRAQVTLELLEAMVMFTESHRDYRFYLTDISSDNIAVDSLDHIKFIDMEHVIILEKNTVTKEMNSKSHITSHFYDCSDCLIFSKRDICLHDISDHNYYNLCKLILWSKAPWPMVSGGLLHSIPMILKEEYPNLMALIDQCVNPMENQNRFDIVKSLINQLDKILSDKDNYI